MGTRRGKTVVAIAAVLVVASTLIGVVFGINTGEARAIEDQGLSIATARVSAALAVDSGAIGVSSTLPKLPGADAVLTWTSGQAQVDTLSGQILLITQAARAGDVNAVLQSNAALATEADRVVGLLGWDEATLALERFEALQSDVSSYPMSEYRKVWVSYTSQGIRDGGLIEVRLDGRDGHVNSFFCFRGAGDVPVDTSAVLAEAKAGQIAVDALVAAKKAQPAIDTLSTSEASYGISSAVLKLCDAPAVTGGTTRLIWMVVLEGQDSSGVAIGGTVYIDAYSGEILRYLTVS